MSGTGPGQNKADAVLCYGPLALPIFVGAMLLMFFLAFGPVGNALYRACEHLFNTVFAGWAEGALNAIGSGPVVRGLLIHGVLAGVGAVMVFLPQLTILFTGLAILEYSGYLSRAAFITDKLLSRLGLSGASFVPLLLGFGCSVPAIMACRILHDKKERLLTMMAVPFISCPARVTVYSLLAAAFFPRDKFFVICALYLLGALFGLLTAWLLRPLLMGRQRASFIMELPPLRRPMPHCIWRGVWARVGDFIAHAGTVLLLASVAMWFLSNFNAAGQMTQNSGGLLTTIGQATAVIFAPLGFGIWQVAVALLMGLMSKEAVISTLAVLYAGQEALSQVISSLLTFPAACSLLVFVLLYTPCIATLTAARRESGSLLFALFMLLYQFAVAWIASFFTYRLLLLIC